MEVVKLGCVDACLAAYRNKSWGFEKLPSIVERSPPGKVDDTPLIACGTQKLVLDLASFAPDLRSHVKNEFPFCEVGDIVDDENVMIVVRADGAVPIAVNPSQFVHCGTFVGRFRPRRRAGDTQRKACCRRGRGNMHRNNLRDNAAADPVLLR